MPWGGTLADTLSVAAGWLILVALAGVGASADLRATLASARGRWRSGSSAWAVILVVGLGLAMVIGPTVYDGVQ